MSTNPLILYILLLEEQSILLIKLHYSIELIQINLYYYHYSKLED